MAPPERASEAEGEVAVDAPQLGSADGFDEAFRSLLPQVRAVAWRILGDEAMAEDVAAEAFIRTLVRWRKVGALPHRDAWVLRVATNLCLDQLRRRRRDDRLLVRSASAVAPWPDVDPTLRLDLVAALAELPKRQREVVVLRHVAGLGEAEVAEAMGVSINTVKTHGARALAALRAGALHELEGANDAN